MLLAKDENGNPLLFELVRKVHVASAAYYLSYVPKEIVESGFQLHNEANEDLSSYLLKHDQQEKFAIFSLLKSNKTKPPREPFKPYFYLKTDTPKNIRSKALKGYMAKLLPTINPLRKKDLTVLKRIRLLSVDLRLDHRKLTHPQNKALLLSQRRFLNELTLEFFHEKQRTLSKKESIHGLAPLVGKQLKKFTFLGIGSYDTRLFLYNHPKRFPAITHFTTGPYYVNKNRATSWSDIGVS